MSNFLTTSIAILGSIAALTGSVCTAKAQTVTAGTATGNLIVDGKSIPLKYSYVLDIDDVEEAGLKLTTVQKYRIIVLSDRALPYSSVWNRDAPASDKNSAAQIMSPITKSPCDTMYGIRLKIDPKQQNPMDAQFLYPGKDPFSFTVVGTEYPDRVTGVTVTGKTISGTAGVAKPIETRLDKGPKKYSYRVSFKAPLSAEPAVTANLSGADALSSPQTAVLRKYLLAGKAGDLDTVKKLTASSHIAFTSNKDAMAFMKEGDASKIAEQVKRVVVRGKIASIVCVNEEPNYSQVMFHLINEVGSWKVQWP